MNQMVLDDSQPRSPEGKRARPASNAVYLSAANLGAKVFSFVFVLYATRALQPALFGSYTTVLAFVGLFGVLTDLGLGTLAVRDVVQDQTREVHYVSNILVLRVVLSLVAIALIIVLSHLFIPAPLHRSVYVYALALLPLAVSNTLQLVFQFTERLAYSAIFTIATSALSALLSILALYTGHHVLSLMIVFTGVTLASTVAIAWTVYTRFLPPRFDVDLPWWPRLLRRSLPFILLTLLNVLYSRVDIQLLFVLSGCSQSTANTGCPPVGLYGAAYRFLDIMVMVFVGSVNAAVLPAFNRVVAESRDALSRLVRSSVTLALAFGVPVAVLATFYAPEALYILAGRHYLSAAPALAILSWAFPCFLVLGMLYNALYALHKQVIVTTAFAVTLVFNVAFNLLLIPRYSYFASAALTVASEVLNGIIVFAVVRSQLGPLGLGQVLLKVAIIAVLAAVSLTAVRPWPIFIGCPIGCAVIILGLRVTGLLGESEHDIVRRMPFIGRYAGLLGTP